MRVTEAAGEGRQLILCSDPQKDLAEKEFLMKAIRLKEMSTASERFPLIVNDNLLVAIVRASCRDIRGNSDVSPVTIRGQWSACGILGYSVEYEEQLQSANASVADYLGAESCVCHADKN